MLIGLTSCLIAALLFFGLKIISTAWVEKGYSNAGHRTLSKMSKWQKKPFDLWAAFPLKQSLSLTARLVHVDETAEAKLGKNLEKAGLSIATGPQAAVARWRAQTSAASCRLKAAKRRSTGAGSVGWPISNFML